MPGKTILEIAPQQQALMIKELRACRYGYLLSLHILLLSAQGYGPTEIAKFLFCSRSSVYRTVRAYRSGKLVYCTESQQSAPAYVRWILRLVKQLPRAYGWFRSRWSCLALSLTLYDYYGISLSRETIRRQLRAAGYEYKRAKLCARDDDPQRAAKLGLIRAVWTRLQSDEAIYFADELDIDLLPKVGYQWMEKGSQLQVMTPGKNQKQYLAGAVDGISQQRLAVVGLKKDNRLFRELLDEIERKCPRRIKRIFLVLDNYKIHKAKAVQEYLRKHSRFVLLWLPAYCPKANPIERIFGDVHDHCTRNHCRKRLSDLVADVMHYFPLSKGWNGQLPSVYFESQVSKAVVELTTRDHFYYAA